MSAVLWFRLMTGSYAIAETVVNRIGLCHKKPTDQNDFYTERKAKKQAFQDVFGSEFGAYFAEIWPFEFCIF